MAVHSGVLGQPLDANNIIGTTVCDGDQGISGRSSSCLHSRCGGTGVGFSVENQFIKQLPVILNQTGQFVGVHVVGDRREAGRKRLRAGP